MKESLIKCRPAIEDIDREFNSIVRKCKKEQADQIKRVNEKLKDEWAGANKAHKERYDK